MSIEINSIKQNQINTANNSKIIAFKSKPMPNDKIELSTKKELSNGTKIGIGVGIATVIGLGIELIWGKGKHLKTLWEKISGKGGKKPPKKPEGTGNKPKGINEGEKPKTTGSNTIPQIADFRTVDEAKEYFESIGIKTFFNNNAKNHINDLNNVKNDIYLLEKNGVEYPSPNSIIIADWSNKEELKRIYNTLNIDEQRIINKTEAANWAWGSVERSNDGKMHLLINSERIEHQACAHEMGHVHQDKLRTSYWHHKGLTDEEFMKKQMEVLGISNIKLHDGYVDMLKDQGDHYIKSILRGCNGHNNFQNLKRIFPNIETSDSEKIFAFKAANGKDYLLNAKKMVDKMASEIGPFYAPTKTYENVAEIFSKLNHGKEFSDLVMLMYDINGGGRIPNLIIKGKRYDDYIESLYNNPDLIRQLRECIEVKELV